MRNPYIIDRPLGPLDPFFGREDALAAFIEAIREGVRLHILYGKPRIGKTSFINQLTVRLGEDYIVKRIAWEETPSEGELLGRILWAFSHALGLSQIVESTEALKECWRTQRELFSSKAATIICVDGIPVEMVAPGSDWSTLLRSLGESLPSQGIILVFVVEGLPEECEPPPEEVHTLVLEGLTRDETEDILFISGHGQFTYDLESMGRIYALTGGEPYLVQLFGYTLFEQHGHRGWVSLADIDGAVPRVIERATQEFLKAWERCSLAAQVVLCVFAEGIGTHGISSADDIRRRVLRHQIEVPLDHIQQALTELERHGLVERLGGGLYHFRSTLFLEWVRKHHALSEVVRLSREYRRIPQESTPTLLSRRIDWLGLSLWLLIIALVVAIGSVWRSRETLMIWTSHPPTETPPQTSVPAVVPTPEELVFSTRIAYMAKDEASQTWDIYVMNAQGLDPVRLTENEANDTLPIWSPDARQIAFVSDRDGNREIYAMNADGTGQVNLTRNAAEDWTPSWSPDGQKIAFASFRDGNWEIYIMNADGSDQRRITNHPAADYSPAWSPNGEWIAFVSDRTGNLEIFIMRPDGSGLRQFTNDPATDQSPAWSPDSQTLIWESYRYGNMEILAASLNGEPPRNISQDAYANDHGPSWSPDGKRIVYFSDRDKGWDIFTLDLTTGERTNLTESMAIEQYPVWAP